MPLYLCGQFGIALLLALLIDAKGLVHGLLAPTQIPRTVSIIFGGFFVAQGDFLCSCAMNHLSFTIAFPVYAGLAMALGSVFTFLAEGSQGNAALLFSGVAIAIMAIICLALADLVSRQQQDSESDPSCNASHDKEQTVVVTVHSPVHTPGESTVGGVRDAVDMKASTMDTQFEIDKETCSSSNNDNRETVRNITEKEDTCGNDKMSSSGTNSSNSNNNSVRVGVDSERKSAHVTPSSPPPVSDVYTMCGLTVWFWLCLLSGLLASLWSPLSNLGMQREQVPADNASNDGAAGGVSGPYTGLVLFQAGQLSGLPLMLVYHAAFISPLEERIRRHRKLEAQRHQYHQLLVLQQHQHPLQMDERDTARISTGASTVIDISAESVSSRDPWMYVTQLLALSLADKGWGLLTGSFVGTGYTLYFTASDAINPTVALAIASCEPLMTIFLGVAEGQLRKAGAMQKGFMFGAIACFILAIALLALSA